MERLCIARAILACPAIHGFHPLVTYTRTRDGSILVEQESPMLYCCDEGMYACHIKGDNIDHLENFHVFSKNHMCGPLVCIYVNVLTMFWPHVMYMFCV